MSIYADQKRDKQAMAYGVRAIEAIESLHDTSTPSASGRPGARERTRFTRDLR